MDKITRTRNEMPCFRLIFTECDNGVTSHGGLYEYMTDAVKKYTVR